MKKKVRSEEDWQRLFAQRENFSGNTAEFCRQQNISRSNFYAKRQLFTTDKALFAANEQSEVKATPYFIKVRQKAANAKPQNKPEATVTFHAKTGELNLPAQLGNKNIIAIIKGLIL